MQGAGCEDIDRVLSTVTSVGLVRRFKRGKEGYTTWWQLDTSTFMPPELLRTRICRHVVLKRQDVYSSEKDDN